MNKQTKDSYPSIGGWLRERIKETGWTNEKVIDYSGLRREVFYRLLKGGCKV